jgi:hypothetical protein
MSNQGKRPEQYEDSTRFAWISVAGMVILLILAALLGGCASTKETPKECCKSEKALQ